jgi:hypothetical protein
MTNSDGFDKAIEDRRNEIAQSRARSQSTHESVLEAERIRLEAARVGESEERRTGEELQKVIADQMRSDASLIADNLSEPFPMTLRAARKGSGTMGF